MNRKNRKFLSLLALVASCAHLCVGAEGSSSSAAIAQVTHKTYHNPILTNEMADPDVIRVDGKYYLYATTHTRGYDAFVSDDLVHWENKGLAFDDPRGGDWAPDVFYFKRGDGKFYLFMVRRRRDYSPKAFSWH